MGQKCNPTGLRIGVIKNWDSRWYAKKGDFAKTLVDDHKLREYLLETLKSAGVPKIEIERDAKRVRINIHCAKPGMVIGKQGAEIEKLKAICAKKLGKSTDEVFINIMESSSLILMQYLFHRALLHSLKSVFHSAVLLSRQSVIQ